MADLKISALTAATTPLAGTEVLPIVQSSTTKKVSTDDLTVKNIRSNATSGILQVAGPAAASTRVMTTPDANFSAARIDAGQTLFGIQRFTNNTDNDASIDIYGNSTGGDPYMKGYDRNGATNFEFICDTGTTDRRFDYYGKVRVYNSNFVVGTSGNGIDFSATAGTGTSELLADYEEGTFTPTVIYSGTNTPTYLAQLGRYTKVGRTVQVQIYLGWNENGSTGNVTFGSLPFTSVTSNARAVASVLSFGLLVTTLSITGFVNTNATTITLFLNDNAGTVVSATNTDNDQDVYVTVTYEAA